MTPENHIDVITEIFSTSKKESEVEKEINRIIKKHERLIQILESIKSFEKRIDNNIESLNGFAGTFLSNKKKYINDIDTQKKCVTKLINLYYKTLQQINE